MFPRVTILQMKVQYCQGQFLMNFAMDNVKITFMEKEITGVLGKNKTLFVT